MLARASGDAGALSLGVEQAKNAILTLWDSLEIQIGAQDMAKNRFSLVAGIAGFSLPGRAKQLEEQLAQFNNVELVSDGYGALLGATNGGPGALISIGTGVTAVHLGKDGKTRTASGWGFPAGDVGGGAWLGLSVLRDTLKHIDGLDLSPALPVEIARQVLKKVGTNAEAIMAWQSEARAGDFASLAPIIVSAARDGVPYGISLMHEAGEKIARIGQALTCDSEAHVYLSGGLAPYLISYCKKGQPDIKWTVSKADALYGLYLLGSHKAPALDLTGRPSIL